MTPEYLADPRLNWSRFRRFLLGSPLHYAFPPPDADTASRREGRALHTMVLEPHRWYAEYVVWDGDRRAGKAWDAFEAEHADKTILRRSDFEIVRAQAEAVLARRDAPLGDDHEEVVRWIDPDTGHACKGLIDARGPGWAWITDLKGSGSLDVYQRLAYRDGHAHQLAWYRRGVRAAHGVTPEAFLVAVETKTPHDVGVWKLSEALLDHCEREIVEGLHRLARCQVLGRWPGRFPALEVMEVPTWALPDDVEIDDEGVGDVG